MINFIRKYKHTTPSGALHIGLDKSGSWYVEKKGGDWRPTITSDKPIWVSNKKWNSIPESMGINEDEWTELRKNIQEEEQRLQEQESKVDTTPEDIIDEATRIVVEGDPVGYVMGTFKELHQGDVAAGKLVYCCQFTPHIPNSKGLHPKATGESGKGKSFLIESVLHTIPEEWWIKGSLSSKALFYHNIRPGTIVFCDDYQQNDDIDTILKNTTSRFHKVYIHRTVSRSSGELVGKELPIPPELVWAITSVDSDQDTQVLNRVVPLDVDDSPETDRAVADGILIQAKYAMDDLPETRRVKVCREVMKILKSKRYRVAIPYADRILWHDPSNRRNLSIFLDIVRAIAFWRRFKRDIVNEEIVANEDDFREAAELYCGGQQADSFATKLTAKELKFAKAIADHDGRLARQDAARILGVSVGRIDQLARGKQAGGERKGGLEQKLKGFRIEQESDTYRYDDARSKTVRTIVYHLEGKLDYWGSFGGVVELSDVPVVEDTQKYPRNTSEIPSKNTHENSM